MYTLIAKINAHISNNTHFSYKWLRYSDSTFREAEEKYDYFQFKLVSASTKQKRLYAYITYICMYEVCVEYLLSMLEFKVVSEQYGEY